MKNYQQYGSKKIIFSDKFIINQEIKKNNKLFNDWKINILNENCGLKK